MPTIKVTSLSAPNTQTGTSYTLSIGDEVAGVTLNNASSITLTLPSNASVAFPIGSQILFAQLGAGQVTVAYSSPVTVVSEGSHVKLRTAGSPATLWKTATDAWVLMGDLTA
ncbi:MAG: hypothetical protein KME27_10560 [Lyngbya sp. HA4199-MV5]|jgi:hypothetical protein|nr:hypothetical protein [Lyngbya sp. HA4199-MV5]